MDKSEIVDIREFTLAIISPEVSAWNVTQKSRRASLMRIIGQIQ